VLLAIVLVQQKLVEATVVYYAFAQQKICANIFAAFAASSCGFC
jgi:hypothetical protein